MTHVPKHRLSASGRAEAKEAKRQREAELARERDAYEAASIAGGTVVSTKDGATVFLDSGTHMICVAREHRVERSVPAAGAVATVEEFAQLRARVTAARIALRGPFAFLARKKLGDRELVLVVEAPGAEDGFSVPVVGAAPARELARRVAALNAELARAAGTDGSVESATAANRRVQPDAGTSTASDPVEQIRRLAELRDQGIVTAEEFELKKRELLARL